MFLELILYTKKSKGIYLVFLKGFTCNNVPGSYKCIQKKCEQGYVFDYNLGDCERIVCKDGFEMNSEGVCVDINECERSHSVCRRNEKCYNTVGSYKCVLEVCEPGYEIDSDRSQCVGKRFVFTLF